jgi:hypothetical protein
MRPLAGASALPWPLGWSAMSRPPRRQRLRPESDRAEESAVRDSADVDEAARSAHYVRSRPAATRGWLEIAHLRYAIPTHPHRGGSRSLHRSRRRPPSSRAHLLRDAEGAIPQRRNGRDFPRKFARAIAGKFWGREASCGIKKLLEADALPRVVEQAQAAPPRFFEPSIKKNFGSLMLDVVPRQSRFAQSSRAAQILKSYLIMIFYQMQVCDINGNEATVCIAARSHQEAVDILIGDRAQGVTGAFERFLTCAEANMLIENLDWLELSRGQGGPARAITVWELGMPAVPGYADHKDCKTIGLDIEASLKVQGLIAPDFVLGCREEDTASSDEI